VDANGRIASIQIHEGTSQLMSEASSGGIWRTDPTTGLSPFMGDLGKESPNLPSATFAVHPFYPNDSRGQRRFGKFWKRRFGMCSQRRAEGGVRGAKIPMLGADRFYRIAYMPRSLDVAGGMQFRLFRSEHGPDGPWPKGHQRPCQGFCISPIDPIR